MFPRRSSDKCNAFLQISEMCCRFGQGPGAASGRGTRVFCERWWPIRERYGPIWGEVWDDFGKLGYFGRCGERCWGILGEVWDDFGRGVGVFWERCNKMMGTSPRQSAPQAPERHFPRERPRQKKRTSPQNSAHLSQKRPPLLPKPCRLRGGC